MDFTDSNTAEFEHFQRNLCAQAELYRTLLELAKRQTQEIAGKNLSAFLQTLEEKKKVITAIGDIELATIPLRESWEAHKDMASVETRAKLRSVVDEIRAVLEELLRLESASQEKLGITKDTVEEELRQISTGTRAMSSYKGLPACKPRFMDKTG